MILERRVAIAVKRLPKLPPRPPPAISVLYIAAADSKLPGMVIIAVKPGCHSVRPGCPVVCVSKSL
jgi:hypothetical protein